MKPSLTITISNQGLQPEREYSVRILLTEFLGPEYELKYHSQPHYIIQVSNGMITMDDAFFANYDQAASYLKKEEIPQQICFLDVSQWNVRQLPVLFGNSTMQISDHQIQLGADLFAAIFFMLSRWEENANPARDEHHRFPGNESLAYKQDFLDRPVVNEYADLLWRMLQQMGYTGQRKSRQFKIVPTHDIDDLVFWTESNKKRRFLNLAGDLVKRGQPKMAMHRWKSHAETQQDIKNDPYNTYDHLMDLAENKGVSAHFYFMAGGETAYDRPYDLGSNLFKETINNIKARGHTLGFHASYDTYQTPDLFKDEKKRLEQAIEMEITEGRQHYLRFENPLTAQIWEGANLQTDSTLYYSGYPGFRCGSCYAYPLFDVLQRKQLDVIEQPLLAMDCCFEGIQAEQAARQISEIKLHTKKHEGDFTFLVHNASYVWMNAYPSFKTIEKAFYDL